MQYLPKINKIIVYFHKETHNILYFLYSFYLAIHAENLYSRLVLVLALIGDSMQKNKKINKKSSKFITKIKQFTDKLPKLPKLPKMAPEKKAKLVNFFNKTSGIWHFVLAVVLCLFIESCSRHSVPDAFHFMVTSPWIFLYNTVIIFVTFFVVYFFKRRVALRFTLGLVWCFLGVINGCILAKRVTPFSYTDLKLVGDLFAMNSTYFTVAEEIVVIILVAIVVGLNVLLYVKGPKYQGKRHPIVASLLVGSCFMWLPMVTEAAVESEVLSNYFENIALGYKEYGFVYGFSTSVVGTGMDRPIDYTEETVTGILDSMYNQPTTVTSEDAPNIIIVLLESFIDPSDVNYLNTSEDPVPNFHYLEDNFTTGYLTVPVVGAGTANTEFEVLTGMSMRFFGTGEYPYKTILKETDCESVASDLNQNLNYSTHVVHNNTAKFYSRNNAFSMMGFDSFTSKEFMNITEYNPLGTWPTDHILLSEVEKAMDDSENQQDFVYCITVQGHGAYPTESVIENPTITVSGSETQEQDYAWEYYVNEIHEVDQFIGDLVNQLNERDEKTLLVLYGDHLPTMDLEADDMESGSTFKTKYVTWNNFDMPKNDANLTSYQLTAYMLNQVGIHEGTIFKYHQNYLNSSYAMDQEKYLSGLEDLQYDLLYGNRYAYDGEDLYPASDLEMGVWDVTIDSVAAIGDRLYVYGSNFTPWTKVYINDEKCSTKFVSTDCITVNLNNHAVAAGDHIAANVVGSDTILRKSNEYIFPDYSALENVTYPIIVPEPTELINRSEYNEMMKRDEQEDTATPEGILNTEPENTGEEPIEENTQPEEVPELKTEISVIRDEE